MIKLFKAKITRLSMGILISLTLLLYGCNSDSKFKNYYTLGIDPSFFPLALEGKQNYVLGFLDDLLLFMTETSLNFIKVYMSWDNLIEGLKLGKYDAAISPIPKTPENEKHFDFSDVWLKTGPVLVVPEKAKISDIKEFKDGYIGCIQFSQEDFYVQTQMNILPHYYQSAAQALLGLANGEVDGVLIGVVPAVSYVKDLYAGLLKIVGEPIGDSGLRLIVKKGENAKILELFNFGIEDSKASRDYKKMLDKWQVGY